MNAQNLFLINSLNGVFDENGNFYFSVVYEGDVVSKMPLEGKHPIGVYFDNYLIGLNEPPFCMTHDAAMQFCAKLNYQGKIATPGGRDFWMKLVQCGKDIVDRLNRVFVYLGGQALKFDERYWVVGKKSKRAWTCNMKNHDFYRYLSEGLFWTRPVVSL